jgi:hypothetical protein
MNRTTIRVSSAVFLFLVVAGSSMAQDRGAGRFTGVDKKVVDAARESMAAHPDAYYYVCRNGPGRPVLRASRRPLAQPGGLHPDRPTVAPDILLGSFGGRPSPAAIEFLRTLCTRHNAAVGERSQEPIPAAAPSLPEAARPTVAPPDRPATAISDLDRLLRLVALAGTVENNSLHSYPPIDENTGEGWINEFEKLPRAAPPRGSGNPAARAVADAVTRLEPVADAIRTSLAEQEAMRKRIAEISSEMAKLNLGVVGEQFSDLWLHPYWQYSEDQLEELRSRGGEFENKVNEFRRRRSELQRVRAELTAPFMAEMDKVRNSTRERIRPLLEDAEARRNAVAHEVLLPALRARSGPERTDPGLEVIFSTAPRGSAHFGYLAIESQSSTELTQLSLLVKIETSAGDRVVLINIPKLPPKGVGRFAPVSLPGGRPEITAVRYAAWCSQLRAERQTATILTTQEMVSRSWLQAIRPGTTYVSRGGTMPDMSVQEILEARRRDPAWRMQSEQDRRFEITFRRVTPAKDGYTVELDLVDHEASRKLSRFRGSLRLPAVTLGKFGEVLLPQDVRRFGEMGRPEEDFVLVQVRSGAEEMELRLWGSWNSTERRWLATRGPARGRQFVPTAAIPAADSPEGVAKERLAAAMALAMEGKFEEARNALEKVVADYPDTDWETAAKFALSKLESMKAGREKAEELRKRLGGPRR